MARSWFVYYLFDPSTDELLYIGRSHDPKQRRWAFEHRTGIKAILSPYRQRYSDIHSACAAELRAIIENAPLHNKHLVSSVGNIDQKRGPMIGAHKARIRNSMIGQKRGPLSLETKAKLSAVRKGRKVSTATRQKLSQAAVKQWKRQHHQENTNVA